MIYPPSRPTEDVDLESPRRAVQTREIATWLVVMAFAAAVVFNVSGINWGFVSDRLLGQTEDVIEGPDPSDNGLELPEVLETPAATDEALDLDGADGNTGDGDGDEGVPGYPGDASGDSRNGLDAFPTPRSAITPSPPTDRQVQDTPEPPITVGGNDESDTETPARGTATETPDEGDGYPSADPPTSTPRSGYP